MGLRSEAAADLAEIFADTESGFGWPTTVTDPAETAAAVVGRTTDIGQTIDLATGQIVSARLASASFRISDLATAGFMNLPVHVSSTAGKPWRVDFDDADGNAHTFRVVQTFPDRAAGVVVCILELYQP